MKTERSTEKPKTAGGVLREIQREIREQENIRELPKEPDLILYEIRRSDEPKSEAFAYGRALMKLTMPEKKDFCYKSELNLLSLILLYVARAEYFIPNMIATGSLTMQHEPVSDEMRTSAEVIDCMEDPVTFRLALEQILHMNAEDNKLLRYGFNAYMTSKVRDNVAASLAVESEIIKYLTYGKKPSLAKE